MNGPDLLRTFEEELRKSAQSIQACLLATEGAPAEEALRSLHEAYRLTHSVKGASRVVGLAPIEEMAHTLEDRLQAVVREASAPTAQETTAFLRVVDGFVAALDAFLQGVDFDPAPFLASFQGLRTAGGAPAPGTDAPVVPSSRGLLRPAADPGTEATPAAAPEPKRDEFLRIPAGRVDELFRRVEEAFLIEARVAALVARLDEEASPTTAAAPRIAPDLRREVARLHQVLLHFHEVVRLMRMEPLERLRVPLQRAARDLAQHLGKELRFHLHGRQEMVDAAILDALQEPLLHLVRNAVDHGLETPAEREAAGKPRQARVEVRAAVQGGMLAIGVEDDGRGISAEAVRDRAVALGLLEADTAAAWTPAQSLELLFHPGFSTAREVTAISGRGLGLDIVRARLRGLGGDGQLTSTPGQGTRFEMRVPIRLLTARTLLVRCGEHRAGLPIDDVTAVFALQRGAGELVAGRPLVRWNGLPVPLEPLGPRLGWVHERTDRGHVVVVSGLDGIKALLVDEVLGEIEQPAVPPPANLAELALLAGVIVLGDGDIVPLLDARELVRTAGTAGETPAADLPAAAEPPSARQRVLIVEDSPTVRALHRSILDEAGYDVLVAEDGAEALATLDQRLVDLVVTDIQMPHMDGLTLIRKIRERASWDRLPIVVVSQYGRQDDLQKAAALGADRYIVKSAFQAEQLLAIVAELLER